MNYSLAAFLSAPTYLKLIDGEIPKPGDYQCFQGAWYYKALSAKNHWLGIEAKVTLPLFSPDENRYEFVPSEDSTNGRYKKYLDTPSVYVGGSSDYETDIGFGWFRGLVNNDLSEEKITFRPFWRHIFLDDSGKIQNLYKGTALTETNYYFFPGDQVHILLFCPEPDYLQFRVEIIKPTEIMKYKQLRQTLHLENDLPSVLLTEKIKAPGNGRNLSEYKRVNAIDQYHNEGRPTQMTEACVFDCIWEDVFLFRKIEESLVKVPFDEKRYIRMMCPCKEAFVVEAISNGERIKIMPRGCNKK